MMEGKAVIILSCSYVILLCKESSFMNETESVYKFKQAITEHLWSRLLSADIVQEKDEEQRLTIRFNDAAEAKLFKRIFTGSMSSFLQTPDYATIHDQGSYFTGLVHHVGSTDVVLYGTKLQELRKALDEWAQTLDEPSTLLLINDTVLSELTLYLEDPEKTQEAAPKGRGI